METDENQGGQTKNLWPFAPNFLQKYVPTLTLNRAGAPDVYRPMCATCVLPYVHCVSKNAVSNFSNHFIKCLPILKIFSLLETANYVQNEYNNSRHLLEPRCTAVWIIKK